jgi:G:T/U-mismatch repair DNA glycosylase
MQITKHQFINSDFFIPSWEVQHLFIGTFNPQNGQQVPYFYGRPRNQTWPLLSKIFGETMNPQSGDFFQLIKKHRIACMDMIKSVEAPDSLLVHINGQGFSDSKIINTEVQRTYNTDSILTIICSNPGAKVYTTWGKGSTLKNWVLEIERIPNRIQLVSPSMAARVPKGNQKFEYMLNDWSSKIMV